MQVAQVQQVADRPAMNYPGTGQLSDNQAPSSPT